MPKRHEIRPAGSDPGGTWATPSRPDAERHRLCEEAAVGDRVRVEIKGLGHIENEMIHIEIQEVSSLAERDPRYPLLAYLGGPGRICFCSDAMRSPLC